MRNENNPLVSVVIPTYNRAELLPRAIKSVLSQTFKDFELIIVDDGSTDDTKEVVKKFQEKDKRIKYIWQKNSGGPASPLNNGIKNSLGEYISFLEDDDEWLPKKTEEQLSLFQKSKMIGLVGCNAMVTKNNKLLYIYKTPSDCKNYLKELLESNIICSTGSVLIKKSVLEEVGLFDEKLSNAQDLEMWIRVAEKGYFFTFSQNILFKYNIYEQSISHSMSTTKAEKDLFYIFDKYEEHYKKKSKIYSNKLRYDGTRYILMNESRKGKKSFLKSIKINPLNIKSYLYFFLSFLGPNVYKKLTLIKGKTRIR